MKLAANGSFRVVGVGTASLQTHRPEGPRGNVQRRRAGTFGHRPEHRVPALSGGRGPGRDSAGADALQTEARSSAGSRARAVEDLGRGGVRAQVRSARPAIARVWPPAPESTTEGIAPRLRPRQPSAISRGARPGSGGSRVRPGSAAGWADGAAAEGRAQGARGQRGSRAQAPEQHEECLGTTGDAEKMAESCRPGGLCHAHCTPALGQSGG